MKKLMLKRTGTLFVLVVFIFTTMVSMMGLELKANAAGEDDQFDPSKYQPKFQVSVVGDNTVSAGSTNTIKINIKNIDIYTNAINTVFIAPTDDDTFVSSKVVSDTPISYIGVGTSTNASISIDVDKFATEGIHRFKFKLSCVNPWNYEVVSEHTIDLKVVNNQTNANFDIEFSKGESVTAVSGGIFDLPLVLVNDGTLDARDVKVTLSEGSLSPETFTLTSGTGRFDFQRISGSQAENMKLQLKAASSLKSGSYPLSFDISFKDEKGTINNQKVSIWVSVVGSEQEVTALELIEIKPSLTTVKPGESFDVSVKVKNSGDYDARQIKISADGGTALLPVSQNLFIVPTLKKGETKSLIFKFQPSPDAARGGVPITIKVESVDGGQNSTIAQAVSVFVDSTSTGSPEAGKNVPKIIVKSYSSDPTLVKAGEKFTLNLEFLNTHASKTVRNIKGNFVVTESSNETGNVFSPVDSSNTFYIDEIAPKGTVDWTLTLFTIPDALSKTYTVTITFEYEDDMGNPYKADELIGIPVYQPSRFEVSEFSLPPEMPMGQPVYLAFEMYNMGKTDIYNVKLNVEGDFDAQPKSSYFGNFESGRREYFELNVIPNKVGQSNGRIVFQYETASGEKQEVVKEFSMNVTEMMMPPEGEVPVGGKPIPGMEEQPQKKGFIGSFWFFAIIGAVVVAGVVVTIILVRRKRKKDKEFDF